MKEAFFKLPEEKRERIIQAAIAEFSRQGYESGALDRVVQHAGISKGGLYEYIASKQEFFLFLVEHCYDALYRFITDQLEDGGRLPPDIIDRTALVSRIAVDFYVRHPLHIAFINRAPDVNDPRLKKRVRQIFEAHYDAVFASADWSVVAFDRERVLGLLKWLLVRTRNSFLQSRTALRNNNRSKTAYLEEWDFHLQILRKGIYKEA